MPTRRVPVHLASRTLTWPSHDIRSLQRFCGRANHYFTHPPNCDAHTAATVLHDYCAIYDTPPTPLVYAVQHTILAMAISCVGRFLTP